MSRHAIFVGIIGALAASPNLLGALSLYDGGLAGASGTFILHGGLPYRDFWWLYGPGAPVIAAAWTALFGPSVLLLRVLGLLLVGAQTGLAYAWLREQISHLPAALIAVGAVTSATFILGVDLTAWSLALVLAMAGLWVRNRLPDRALLAGVLVGLAFVARLDVGSYALIAGCLLSRRRRSFLAGTGVVAVPAALLFVVTTPLGDLYDQLVWFPLLGTRQFRSLPWPTVENDTAFLFLATMVIVRKLAVAAAGLRVILAWDRSRGLVALTAFAALCQLQTLGRADLYHHAQALVPAYTLLGLAGASLLSRVREPLGRRRAYARLGGFALLVSATALTLITGAFGPLRAETGPLTDTDRQVVAGVRTLVASTAIDEPVFVGLTNHRHTLLNDMLLYYLADRRSGTRVAMFNPGVTNTDAVQTGMAADLATSGTEVLVLDDEWASAFEASNDSRIPGSEVLDEVIANRYTLVCDYGTIRILATPERAPRIACVQIRPDERLIDVLAGIGP